MVPLLTYIQDIDVPVYQSQQKNAHFCARAVFLQIEKSRSNSTQERTLLLHRSYQSKNIADFLPVWDFVLAPAFSGPQKMLCSC